MTTSAHECCECPICRALTRARKSDVGLHLMNARKEILLAVKAMIDIGLDSMDNEPSADDSGARKVNID